MGETRVGGGGDSRQLTGSMRSISRRAAVLALGTVTLAACAREGKTEDGKTVDLGGLDEAVNEASPRVTGIEESAREVNGLGHALYLSLVLDTTVAPTADELDVIVEAIWKNVPWEPNAIRLVAGSGGATGETMVDLEEATSGLEPMRFRPFGNLGVSLLSVDERYGEWKKPA